MFQILERTPTRTSSLPFFCFCRGCGWYDLNFFWIGWFLVVLRGATGGSVTIACCCCCCCCCCCSIENDKILEIRIRVPLLMLCRYLRLCSQRQRRLRLSCLRNWRQSTWCMILFRQWSCKYSCCPQQSLLLPNRSWRSQFHRNH